MQRSEKARAVPAESRQRTSGSSRRRVASGPCSRSRAKATGCQQLRSAGWSPTAEGEAMPRMLVGVRGGSAPPPTYLSCLGLDPVRVESARVGRALVGHRPGRVHELAAVRVPREVVAREADVLAV